MGDLDQEKEQQDLALDQQEAQPQPQDEEMQSIGGQQNPQENVQADKAVTLQKLEQLKQQDDPAKLFQLLQQAESGESEKQPANAKDW